MRLFPVDVVHPASPEVPHRHCLVTWDGRTTIIWVRQSGADVIVAESTQAPVRGPRAGRKQTWTLMLGPTDGVPADTVPLARITEGGGCGCGHPYKRHTPTRTSGAHRVYTDPEVADA